MHIFSYLKRFSEIICWKIYKTTRDFAWPNQTNLFPAGRFADLIIFDSCRWVKRILDSSLFLSSSLSNNSAFWREVNLNLALRGLIQMLAKLMPNTYSFDGFRKEINISEIDIAAWAPNLPLQSTTIRFCYIWYLTFITCMAGALLLVHSGSFH